MPKRRPKSTFSDSVPGENDIFNRAAAERLHSTLVEKLRGEQIGPFQMIVHVDGGVSVTGGALQDGGNENIAEAINTLMIASLETRLVDEHLEVPLHQFFSGGLLHEVDPKEHDMDRELRAFTRTVKENSKIKGHEAREIGLRVLTITSAAMDAALGRTR